MEIYRPEVKSRWQKAVTALAGLGLTMSFGGCTEEDTPNRQNTKSTPSTFSCESVKYIESNRSDYVFVDAVNHDGTVASLDSVTAESLGSKEKAIELKPLTTFNNKPDAQRYAIRIDPKTSQLVIKLHKGDEIARCQTLDSPLRPFNPPSPELTSN